MHAGTQGTMCMAFVFFLVFLYKVRPHSCAALAMWLNYVYIGFQ